MGTFDVELRVAPVLRAPEAARHSLETLRAELDDRTVDDAALLVSELVTNSIRHAGLGRDEPIRVLVHRGGSSLRVEVTDAGPGFDPADVPAPRAEGGWGLRLLDRIADRWGVSGDDATQVWFELDTVSSSAGPGRSRPHDRTRGGRRWAS